MSPPPAEGAREARLGETAVVVTGATGFLGSALVPELVERGARVHALARRSSTRGHLAGLAVQWHEADLLDPETLDAALACVRAEETGKLLAIHAAGAIGYRAADAAWLERTNVAGTWAFLAACERAGVTRVVHVSSVVACGVARDASSRLDEEAPWRPQALRSVYARTKREGEELALAPGRSADVVSVLPGAIFGPSARPSNTARFLAALRDGALGALAPPGSLAVVGLRDVARGTVLALEHGRPRRRYLLTESNWRLVDLLRLAARELGVRAPRAACPGFLWPLVVRGAALIDRVRPIAPASPESLRLLGAHFRFDAQRARDELGWEPQPFVEVLRRTIAGLAPPGPSPPDQRT